MLAPVYRADIVALMITSVLTLAACSSSSTPSELVPVDTSGEEDTTQTGTEFDVTLNAPPTEVVQRLSLDSSFYQQYLDADGIPVVASAAVNPYALHEAAWILENMLAVRPDISAAISSTQVRLAIMAVDEFTTDIPEYADLQPADYWDRRARGLGATELRPAVSSGEENLLQLPGDPYATENILVHEFAHVIHQQGLASLDSTFQASLQSTYDLAVAEGLWEGTYAATNTAEYFAEGVQSWFGTNRENDAEHNSIDTRAELIDYDPRLAALLTQVFGDNSWQYEGPSVRETDREHLAGFDVDEAGSFSWPAHLENVDISVLPDTDPDGARVSNVLEEDWTGLASPGSDEAVDIVFFNNTDAGITVDWIDFEGQRQRMFTLTPGASSASLTYVGHLWEVADLEGVLLARFRAEAGAALAVIE